jgi:archaemetzincin
MLPLMINIMDRREFFSLMNGFASGLFLPQNITKKADALILPMESLEHQPLGRKGIPSKYIEHVKIALNENYGTNVIVSAPVPLPDAAYYRPRNRYRAPVIIDEIKQYSGKEHIIGLTPVDISQADESIADWGVFGVAQLGGRCSVISYFRLGTGEEMIKRLEKVSAHEFGHLLGIEHCSDEKCTMSDIKGSRKNLDKIKYNYFCKEHAYLSTFL